MAFFKKLVPLIGLFLVSVSLLMIQILFLRFSRVAFIYNLQFIILSSAILGIGVGSLIVHVRFNNKHNKELGKLFLTSSLFYSIFSILPFFILHLTNFYPKLFIIISFFISELLVYIFAGVLIGLTFRYFSKIYGTNMIYFINMFGSGLGAFLAIFLLDKFGINAIIFNFVITLFIGIIYAFANEFIKIKLFLLIIVVVTLILSSRLALQLRVICYPSGRLVNSLVNSISQVDLYQMPEAKRYQYSIYFECIYPIPLENGNSIGKNGFSMRNFPFVVKKYDNAIIIGSGGGFEVVGGVANRIRKITAVEINPLVILAVNQAIPDNIYKNKTVQLVFQEARNYINTSHEKFDLIYIPATKNYGSIGFRSFVLQENYLYTKDALKSYINHLSDDGILAMLDRTLIPQYLSTLQAALLDNHKNTKNIILVSSMNNERLILYKNNGFSQKEIVNIRKLTANLNYQINQSPNNPPNVPVLTVDRPYFVPSVESARPNFDPSHYLGLLQISQDKTKSMLQYGSVLLLAIYFFSYLIINFNSRFANKYKLLFGLFTFIGIGFINIELYLIEKISVLLGHPSFSIALALALVLMVGGLGSLLSRRLSMSISRTAGFIVLISIIYFFSFDPFIRLLSETSLWLRIIIAVFTLSIPSLLMGMLFSKCLSKARSISGNLLPFVLAVDGLASVLGSFIFKLIALYLGFKFGLIIGTVSYIGVILLLNKNKKVI